MPNFDAGHYFLTTLAPIKPGADANGVSHVQSVRRILADLRTALQSPATESIAQPDQDGLIDRAQAEANNSPFAKSLRTHLCRYVVIDDAIYNGRLSADPILVSLGRAPKPLDPQHVDHLPCPYLFFSADIDAILTPGDPLRSEMTPDEENEIRDSYVRELWEIAGDKLGELYSHCQDFDVKDADGFAAYLARCQIETWMPFNDYYIDKATELADLKPLPIDKLKKIILAPVLLTVACLVFGLIDAFCQMVLGFSVVTDWVWAGVPLFALATALALQWAYKFALENGRKSWPAATYGSLTAVLKGLYIQQHFADFVIENQGASAKDLHKNFGKFLKDRKPSEALDPKTNRLPKTTQLPGVIGSVARPRKKDDKAA